MSPSLATLKANTIIKNLRIRHPSEISIKDIAMERGAYAYEQNISGAEAWLVKKGERAIITVSNKLSELGRKRFAIAHELGHFELHNDSQLVICGEEDMCDWNRNKQQEVEANEFASSILMPEVIFARYMKKEVPNMDSVLELTGEFRTTMTATTLRYVQLSHEPCAVAISNNCVLKWYRKSDSFDFHLKVGRKLSPDNYAFDFYNGKDLPARPRKVPATAWIAGEIDPDSEIVEHSVALKSYGIVLSLLWVDKEIRFRFEKCDDGDPEFDLTDKFTPDGKVRYNF